MNDWTCVMVVQEFVAHDGDTSEVGASRFASADVRRIGILDIRLFNTDRHAGSTLLLHLQLCHRTCS